MISFNGRVYFTESELRCKKTHVVKLGDGFAEQLLALRLVWNKPMHVTSACRSSEHNADVGGATRSYHIYDDDRGGCRAIDLAVAPGDRKALTQLALSMGWAVGIPSNSRGFIHLDRRIDVGEEPNVFGY